MIETDEFTRATDAREHMPYTAEIDGVDQRNWDRLLHEFDDTTIFQTWAYGAARWGRRNLSHGVIKKDGEIIGLAQAVLVGIPILGRVMALVNFGPLWQRRGFPPNIDDHRAILDALHQEYVVRRRLFLRLRPWPHDIPHGDDVALMNSQKWTRSLFPTTTYILDLSRPETLIHSSLDKKWRANLRKSETFPLVVTQQPIFEGINTFSRLHNQMTDRKNFPSDFLESLPNICDSLPDEFLPQVFVCWRENEAVASAIVSAIGNRAFYLNGASGNAALEVRGGYFLQWSIIRWLKQNPQYRWYDLHGVMSSAGVRQFKRGLVGTKAPEIPVDEFEACESRSAAFIVNSGSQFSKSYRRLWLRAKRLIK